MEGYLDGFVSSRGYSNSDGYSNSEQRIQTVGGHSCGNRVMHSVSMYYMRV